ncbi:MAG: helicase [Rhizobiales bacterium]|nr:helicase [Hyphomicrobiales bacterium]
MTVASLTDRSETVKVASTRGVTAVLGPTNTGKTHLAIERLVAHQTGMMGLPLRLLAREVYNKVAARVGQHNVALVTGEEKITPARPRFWICTVEAMPLDLTVDFVAIDEVQLAHSLERGHIFTDRILTMRGTRETMLLGASTARPVLEALMPGLDVTTRPRLSELVYSGSKKISRLPRRSAVVAFSSQDVYAIAELIRRQSGGAAVVLGSLSPRTRNAQVELFQNGDVDYLVATDAIGMGLNLDLDHVALAATRKFDGFQFRDLTPAELGQIAGRAGRYLKNGTFGVTARVEAFSTELVEQLESHSFEPLKVFQWRSNRLDFSSLRALRESLDAAPKSGLLVKTPIGEDVVTLEAAMRDNETRDLTTTAKDVARLWDVCSIPDYRKIAPAEHAALVFTIYHQLQREGFVNESWLASQISRADRVDGDIDTLSNRIAHIRTWTYLANRPDWLETAAGWRDEARKVEDRLSDALHERLVQRFVDRRTSILMKKLRESIMLEAVITHDGDVIVEGEHIGMLEGLRFQPDPKAASGSEAKAVRTAAQKALAGEIEKRSERIAKAPNEAFILSSDASIRWLGSVIGRIVATDDLLAPSIIILADDLLTGPARERVDARLRLWLTAHIGTVLQPLVEIRKSEELTGLARGIAFQLVEAFGILDRRDVGEDIKNLDQVARASLRKFGVRFGAYHIFMPALLKPAPATLLALLWGLKQDQLDNKGIADVPALSAAGRTSFVIDPDIPEALYRVAGFKVAGNRAVRVDILERLADIIRPLLSWKPGADGVTPPDGALAEFGFTVTVAMTSLLGCAGEDFASVLKSLGYRVERRRIEPKPVVATSQEEENPGIQDSPAEETAHEATSPTLMIEQTGLPEPTETTEKAETLEKPTEPAPAQETVNEPVFLEIWRPQPATRDNQPRGDRRENGARRASKRPGKRPSKHDGKPGGEQPSQPQVGAQAEHGHPEARKHDGAANEGAHWRKPKRHHRGGEASADENTKHQPGKKHNKSRHKGGKPFDDREHDTASTNRQKPVIKEKPIDPDSPFAKLAALKAGFNKK